MHRATPLLIAMLLLGGMPAHAAKKVAFVVGIDRYDNLQTDKQLKKAVNDSRAVGATLRAIGFDVIASENAGRLELVRQWQQFLNKVEPGDTAAFFFAGHGVEIGGLNFLLPRDVPRVASGEEEVLKAAALSLSGFLDQVRSKKPQVSFHIIDACRDNPFVEWTGRSIGGGRGLARIEPASGSFVMFSAGAGQTALDRLNDGDPDPNSVYTRTLLRHLAIPGRSLTDIARGVRGEVLELARTVSHVQTPAYYDEVIGRYCPAGCEGDVSGTPKGGSTVDPAALAWATIKDANSVAVLEAFIARFPDTFYADLAKARIEELKATATKPKEGPKLAIGIFPPTDQGGGKDPVATCDALAGSKYDGDAQKKGVKVGMRSWALRVRADEAVKACEAAVKASPDELRYKHQLARALYESIRFKDAIALMEEAANAGQQDAMSTLAYWYSSGIAGIRADKAKSYQWHLKAAEAGNTNAMKSVAQALWQGVGVAVDRAKANEWYRRAHDELLRGAEGGDSLAMYNLAYYYLEGRGRPKDDDRGMAWLIRAAERDNDSAMSMLGTTYKYGGHSVAKNEDMGDRWYRKYADALKRRAAEGDADAMSSLAWQYSSGTGTIKDESEALRWHMKAADADHHYSRSNVGFWYQQGYGGRKDPIEADNWYRKFYDWYRRAADAGDASAMTTMASAYAGGKSVSKDAQEALRLYARAIDQGYPYGAESIAGMYRWGGSEGVAKNLNEAYRWYRRAAEMSHDTAWGTGEVAEMLSKGEGVGRDNRKAAEVYLRYWSQLGDVSDSNFDDIKSNNWDKPDTMIDTRREMQKLLKNAGVYSGAIDAVWGPALRRAAEAYVRLEK